MRWANGPSSFVAVTGLGGPVPSLFFALGERGKLAERVADEAFDAFDAHRKSGCAIDPHLADQLFLPLVLADGPSAFRTSEVTQHLWTNVETVARFIRRDITVMGSLGQPGLVRVSERNV